MSSRPVENARDNTYLIVQAFKILFILWPSHFLQELYK